MLKPVHWVNPSRLGRIIPFQQRSIWHFRMADSPAQVLEAKIAKAGPIRRFPSSNKRRIALRYSGIVNLSEISVILVGSCKLGELILGPIFGLKSEPELAAALSPCTSFA